MVRRNHWNSRLFRGILISLSYTFLTLTKAFAFGIMVPKQGQLVHELAPKIELLIVEFFLPLYFANSGLRTSIGALNTGELWGACIVVILVATIAKIAPVTLVCKAFGRDWRLCITLGILMNTRGNW